MHPADPLPVSLVPARPRPSGTFRRGALPLLLVVSSLAACTDRAERSATASVQASPSAPTVPLARAPDVVFRTLSGERLALAEAAGPTLVAFWSTSCTVCLHEMPALARLRADYAPRGFELVAVAMPHDRPDVVLELAEARGWSFPVALDIDGRVLAAFEPVPGTPTSFLIDADGTVVERHVGPADPGALRSTLERLLDETAPGGERLGGERLGAARLGGKRSGDAPGEPVPDPVALSPGVTESATGTRIDFPGDDGPGRHPGDTPRSSGAVPSASPPARARA